MRLHESAIKVMKEAQPHPTSVPVGLTLQTVPGDPPFSGYAGAGRLTAIMKRNNRISPITAHLTAKLTSGSAAATMDLCASYVAEPLFATRIDVDGYEQRKGIRRCLKSPTNSLLKLRSLEDSFLSFTSRQRIAKIASGKIEESRRSPRLCRGYSLMSREMSKVSV